MSKKPTARPSRAETAAVIARKEAEGELEFAQRAIVVLGRELMKARLEAAHHEGYIERVIDQDRAKAGAAEPEPDGKAIGDLRRLMAYAPDREATAIIEAISPELMDEVLGRPPGPRQNSAR